MYMYSVFCILYVLHMGSVSGSEVIDEIFGVLLSTGMLIGGAVAFFLDNTIPGMALSIKSDLWKKKYAQH